MRTYKKKTIRGEVSQSNMQAAVEAVILSKKSIRSVAAQYKICHVTLHKYVKLGKAQFEQKNQIDFGLIGYKKPHQVFNDNQGKELEEYLKHASKIYFGLTPKDVRHFAYQCAQQFNIKMPSTWIKNKCAGVDWFSKFIKEHPSLSIRTAEQTSIQRAVNFNRSNVSEFFAKLATVRDRYKFTAADIWNVDETGLSTVQRLPKVVAEKGTKQVGGVTSSERGVLVTMCLAVSAIGNSVPPLFLFPRLRYQPHFIRDGPPGCVGQGNKSGWMTAQEFLFFIKHFVSHVRPSESRPVLLLLDNHESHLAIQMIDYAKSNGIILLSFPPHCSHKLQPLDKSVYGPLKKYMSSAQDAWMRNNPGRSMTIYDIPGLAAHALPKAVSPENITKGFRATGIEPCNEDIFTDTDFLPATVTDMPLPSAFIPLSSTIERKQCDTQDTHAQAPASNKKINILSVVVVSPPTTTKECVKTAFPNPTPSISAGCSKPASILCEASKPQKSNSQVVGNLFMHTEAMNKKSETKSFSPTQVRPFPKAEMRNKPARGRKKRKACILTDTPEKEALRMEQDACKERKKKAVPKTKRPKKLNEKKILEELSSEEDDTICIVCCEPFSNSKPREEWIQCVVCKQWAHELCTSGQNQFICHHCDSD